MAEMTSFALVEILNVIEGAGIGVWLDGGWGVDALIGKQGRLHKDIDIVVQVADVPRLEAILGQHDFAVRRGSPPDSFVLGDDLGQEVDVHAVVFDSEGNGLSWGTCGYSRNGLESRCRRTCRGSTRREIQRPAASHASGV